MRVCYGRFTEKSAFWGVFVAFKLTIRCVKGVLGDQGYESTTFWTKLGSQAQMNALWWQYDIFSIMKLKIILL